MTLRNGQGGLNVAALLKAFPPAHSGLRRTLAKQRIRCSVAPPEHQLPLPWPLTLAMAASRATTAGYPMHACLCCSRGLAYGPVGAYQPLLAACFCRRAGLRAALSRSALYGGTKVRPDQFVWVHPPVHVTGFFGAHFVLPVAARVRRTLDLHAVSVLWAIHPRKSANCWTFPICGWRSRRERDGRPGGMDRGIPWCLS